MEKNEEAERSGVEQFTLGHKKVRPQPLLNSDIRSSAAWTWLELGLATYLGISTPPICRHSSEVRSYYIIDLWKSLKKCGKVHNSNLRQKVWNIFDISFLGGYPPKNVDKLGIKNGETS